MTHPDSSRVSVAGRDTPRESGPPVAHEMRLGATTNCELYIKCEPCDWRRFMENNYTLEQVTRLAVMHETGEAP